jgi:hypothetical protein
VEEREKITAVHGRNAGLRITPIKSRKRQPHAAFLQKRFHGPMHVRSRSGSHESHFSGFSDGNLADVDRDPPHPRGEGADPMGGAGLDAFAVAVTIFGLIQNEQKPMFSPRKGCLRLDFSKIVQP